MIRKAKNEDVDGILKLLEQVNMVHHVIRPDLFKGHKTKYTKEQLLQMTADDLCNIFVYTDEDGKIKGHLFLEFITHENDNVLTDIKTMYIDDICVDENSRGEHIGKALYDQAISYAKQTGCYNVILNVWEGNEAARSFYESCGMKVQKTGMEMIL